MGDKTYSQEQVNAILRRALEQEPPKSDGLTREQLISAAEEAGIERTSIERALAEEEHEAQKAGATRELALYRRAHLQRQAISWAWVSGLCALINFLTHGAPWFFWVMGPWGAVLLLQLVRLFGPPSAHELEQYERWKQRELRRARRRELKANVKASAEMLEQAISEGVQKFVSALDDKRQLPPRR